MFRKTVILALLGLPLAAEAGLVTLDPDAYSTNSNLSAVSSLAALSTTAGGSVYASSVYPVMGSGQPPEVSGTGPLLRNVFSQTSGENSEWFAWPESDMSVYDAALWAQEEPQAFMVTFNAPVHHVSLLAAEVYGDGFDDPVRWWIYDSADRLIVSDCVDLASNIVAHLGTVDFGDGPMPGFPVWHAAFSHPDIHRVIIGGGSEFTTIDRLQFRTVDIPEPGTAILLLSGLLMATGASLKRSRRRRLNRAPA